MRQGYFRIIFWLSCCLVALTGCKLSGSALVGKWEDTSLPESYIEISQVGIYAFDVVKTMPRPYSAKSEDSYTPCGDALCIVNAGRLTISYDRLRFPEKGNPNLLLNGKIGDETPNFWMKLAGQDTYKRVQ
jgi:hypothetical protein